MELFKNRKESEDITKRIHSLIMVHGVALELQVERLLIESQLQLKNVNPSSIWCIISSGLVRGPKLEKCNFRGDLASGPHFKSLMAIIIIINLYILKFNF